jgi:type I restriction enzyme M protein
LGLLFLRYAEARFADAAEALTPRPGSRLTAGPDAFKARGILYLTPGSRFSHLRDLPEGANIGRALNQAMSDIETNNPELADTLPKNYQEIPNWVL